MKPKIRQQKEHNPLEVPINLTDKILGPKFKSTSMIIYQLVITRPSRDQIAIRIRCEVRQPLCSNRSSKNPYSVYI